MRHSISHLKEHGPRALKSRGLALLRKPKTEGNVVILHNGRSGSTLLGQMLDQHPEIFWDGETYEKQLHKRQAKSTLGFEDMWGLIDDRAALAELRTRMRRRAGGRIFGTELQDYHPQMMGTEIEPYLDKMQRLGFTKFVYLQRNYLRKIVSAATATKTGSFHVKAGRRSSATRIRLNPRRLYIGHRHTTLLDVMREYRAFHRRTISALGRDQVLELSYEKDIENDPGVAASKVFNHIDVEPIEPEVTLSKTTSKDLSNVVENFDEILEVVEQSEFSDQIAPFVQRG